MSDRLTPKDVDVLMSDVEELRNAQYNQGKADGAAQERREIIEMLRIPLAKGPFYLNQGLAEAIAIIEQRSQ